jgi:hypothetical protein
MIDDVLRIDAGIPDVMGAPDLRASASRLGEERRRRDMDLCRPDGTDASARAALKQRGTRKLGTRSSKPRARILPAASKNGAVPHRPVEHAASGGAGHHCYPVAGRFWEHSSELRDAFPDEIRLRAGMGPGQFEAICARWIRCAWPTPRSGSDRQAAHGAAGMTAIPAKLQRISRAPAISMAGRRQTGKAFWDGAATSA